MSNVRGISARIPGIPDDPHEFDDEKRPSFPAVAYRPQPVWDMDTDDYEPLPDCTYSEYRFLGRIPEAQAADRHAAQRLARKQFHPDAKVFKVARYYVAYRIL